MRPMSSSSCATNSEMRAAVRNSERGGSSSIFLLDTQVCFVDWIHLIQSFQEVAPVGAVPDSGFSLPLKEFLFARLFDERALNTCYQTIPWSLKLSILIGVSSGWC